MLGSSNRRSKLGRGDRRRKRNLQPQTVKQCFNAFNALQALHDSAPAPNGQVAEALKSLRKRIISLEKDHNKSAGALAQIERWSARCTAGLSFFIVTPLLALWREAGYPWPGDGFWTDDNVIAAMGSAGGWILATIIVARMVIGAVLGWLFIVIVGCLLFVFLFGGACAP